MFFGSLSAQPWQAVREWKIANTTTLPENTVAVLSTVGSLTRFIEREFHLKLKVVLQDQFIDSAEEDEALLLDCPAGTAVLRRRVSLQHHYQTLFDAESVLPLQNIHADLMQELERGEIPLGNLLIEQGMSLSRTDLSIARIEGDAPYHQCWARRSVLKSGYGTKALVIEVFLPRMWEKLEQINAIR